MLNPANIQKFNFFDDVARRWQEIVGGQLIFLSLNGQIATLSPVQLPPLWQDLLREIPSNQPAALNFSDETVLTAPLFCNQQLLGYLVAFHTTAQDLPLLAWLAEILAARLLDDEALQGMTDELIGAWDQLELIYRVTENLTLASDLMATLRSILEELRRVVHAADGFVLLRRAGTLDCVTCNQLNLQEHIICNQLLFDNLLQMNQVILCNDMLECPVVWFIAPTPVECFLATSLIIPDEACQAVVGLINKADKNFNAGDVKLLAALAQQVGSIIKNHLVHHRLISEERLSRELEIAAEIQESLLPTTLPQVNGLSLAVTYIPASEVGGDFYDFITVEDRLLTLIIGDVAGKGIPAAMLTSVTRTMLRVEVMRGEPPHTVIHRANKVLHQDLSRAESFVTAFVATFDMVENRLSYASAGHVPAILWRAKTKTIEPLKATSPPIGIFGYQGEISRTVNLNPGDTLVFFTDGITEAESATGDYFGLDRLFELVQAKGELSAEALQQQIKTEVTNFCGGSFTRDDATLLVVKMLPQAETKPFQDNSKIIRMIDFAYPADTKYLVDIARDITTTCRQVPLLPNGSNANDFIYLVELAISEICTNIIQHAYAGQKGEIKGKITLLDTGIFLDFFDTGIGFDPDRVSTPKSNPHDLIEGGYGLHIVRQIMDVVSYDRKEQGNHWHLEKFLRLS